MNDERNIIESLQEEIMHSEELSEDEKNQRLSALLIASSRTINAQGGRGGAGIGGGHGPDADGGTIIINGGIVNATGGMDGAGIGGGWRGTGGTITINGGTVNATGGVRAAGIGGGEASASGAITISGGTVTATAGSNNSEAIGCGRNGDGGTLTLNANFSYERNIDNTAAGATSGIIANPGLTSYFNGHSYVKLNPAE